MSHYSGQRIDTWTSISVWTHTFYYIVVDLAVHSFHEPSKSESWLSTRYSGNGSVIWLPPSNIYSNRAKNHHLGWNIGEQHVWTRVLLNYALLLWWYAYASPPLSQGSKSKSIVLLIRTNNCHIPYIIHWIYISIHLSFDAFPLIPHCPQGLTELHN